MHQIKYYITIVTKDQQIYIYIYVKKLVLFNTFNFKTLKYNTCHILSV